MLEDLLCGLISVLELSDPPPSVFPNACSTTEALYNIACSNVNKVVGDFSIKILNSQSVTVNVLDSSILRL